MENQLYEVPEENIAFKFYMGEQLYAVISENEEVNEGDDIHFAKINFIEGMKIVRNIESDGEYAKVKAEFDRLMNEMGDDVDED